jgi:hypothetical protein
VTAAAAGPVAAAAQRRGREWLTPEPARQLSREFADMLAAIHGVDLPLPGCPVSAGPRGKWNGS